MQADDQGSSLRSLSDRKQSIFSVSFNITITNVAMNIQFFRTKISQNICLNLKATLCFVSKEYVEFQGLRERKGGRKASGIYRWETGVKTKMENPRNHSWAVLRAMWKLAKMETRATSVKRRRLAGRNV